MYNITVRRITSDKLLKYWKGLRISGGYGTSLHGSSQLALTLARLMFGAGSFCKGRNRTSRSHRTILGFSNGLRGRRFIRAALSGALHSALRLASDRDVRQVIQDKHVELEFHTELVFHLSQRPESQQ